MSARGQGPQTPRNKKLAPEDAEKLYTRLHTDAIVHKKAALERLERKYYPVAKPEDRKRQSDEQAQETITRLAVKDVELKKKRDEDNAKAATKGSSDQHAASTKKMSETEVEDSVRRLYNDSVRIRTETTKRLEKKYAKQFEDNGPAHGGTSARKRTKEELAESAKRLAVPTKKTFNTDEINKIYGFKEGTPRQKKWTQNGLIDPDANEDEADE